MGDLLDRRCQAGHTTCREWFTDCLSQGRVVRRVHRHQVEAGLLQYGAGDVSPGESSKPGRVRFRVGRHRVDVGVLGHTPEPGTGTPTGPSRWFGMPGDRGFSTERCEGTIRRTSLEAGGAPEVNVDVVRSKGTTIVHAADRGTSVRCGAPAAPAGLTRAFLKPGLRRRPRCLRSCSSPG